MVLLERYFGAIHVAFSALSNAMITSGNYRCNSFSTKHAIHSIATPALYKMSKRPHGKEIVLVYHSSRDFISLAEYKIYVRGNLSMIALGRFPAKQLVQIPPVPLVGNTSSFAVSCIFLRCMPFLVSFLWVDIRRCDLLGCIGGTYLIRISLLKE
jgi:hypothetical protein